MQYFYLFIGLLSFLINIILCLIFSVRYKLCYKTYNTQTPEIQKERVGTQRHNDLSLSLP
jgi:hypothetical protein